MDILLFLVPFALFLGFVGLLAFFWAVRSGQYDDMDGAGERILHTNDDEVENNDVR